ncbi:MAG: alanine--tRNA ligase [Sphingobacteriia bacterium]|nr:alanine--tRNA ligase [Sphingobacteriia bacterium]
MFTTNDIRKSFINFFVNNNHAHVESSPLIPHNDPSLMFTNSGMVQFKNYFTGVEQSKFKTATTSQKCVRAGGKHNDLENVGYTARHHTFFEMLGNFSFGDYFKEQAIFYAWNFLTKEIGLDKNKLYFTVYHTDDEAYNFWKKMGVEENRIIRISTSDNFWSMGDTGPCGPCSEIFYDHGEGLTGGLPGQPDEGGERYVEIWNLVFMQYEQKANGEMLPLPKPSIDTGMGLERFAAAMQGVYDNYQIDLFKNLMQASSEITKTKITTENIASHKVIVDHLRSTAFLIADGIIPSNEGRGYVLRRIMRRAMRHVHHLGCKETVINKLIPSLIHEMGGAYPELLRAENFITETIKQEEERFQETLDRGMKLLSQEVNNLKKEQDLPGEVAFKLYDTYGFPLDLTMDIMRKEDRSVDVVAFEENMKKQKEMARKSWLGSGENATEELWFDIKNEYGSSEFLGYKMHSADAIIQEIIKDGQKIDEVKSGDKVCFITNQTPFYGESGGQMGDIGIGKTSTGEIVITDTKKHLDLHVHYAEVKSGSIKKSQTITLTIDEERRKKLKSNHSATHLLHAVLRKFLGSHITQKGSLVAHDRLRFDISHNKPLSHFEIKRIENEVNKIIRENHSVTTKLMAPKDAIESGAMALFGEKYGEEVRVVSMGGLLEEKDYSIELCGGTHVERTGDIGCFKIISEAAIASGVRRIEAVSGEDAINYIHSRDEILNELSAILKVPTNEFPARLESLNSESKRLEKELLEARKIILDSYLNKFESFNKADLLVVETKGMNFKDLKSWLDNNIKKFEKSIIVVINEDIGKGAVVVAVSNPDIIKATEIAEKFVKALGGTGSGGSPNFAQGGISNVNNLKNAITELKNQLN